MAEQIITVLDLIAFIAFGAAAVLTLRDAPPGGHKASRTPLIFMACAMAIYAAVGVSNALEHSGFTAVFDPYEDYLQVLFAPLLVFAAFAAASNRHIEEQRGSALLLRRQNELLLDIMDTSPVGIMIVAPGGAITFANDPARSILGLVEDPETGSLTMNVVSVSDANGRPCSLAELVRGEGLRGERRVLGWHGGRRTQCMFNATPLADAQSSLGGAVVTVEAVG